MRRLLLSLTCSLAAIAASAEYANPILPGMHPDPSVTVTPEGDFYLVNSTFCYAPGVPLYHSRDLINWEQLGSVLDRPSQLPLDKMGVWGGIYAPTIRYHEGRFYMITTNVGNGGNFLVWTDDLSKGWSEPVWLEQQGIDPSLYFEDGKTYMVSNPGNMIWLCEIDPMTGKQLTESRPLWQGTGGRYPEGPHIYKKDGWYYLLIAEGGTELAHKVTIARSRDIYGPYTPNPANPIITNCSLEGAGNTVQGTGHADFVQAPDGSWWVVFLAYRHQNGSHHLLGRETFLAPVRWDEGAWPVVYSGQPISEKMMAETLPLHPFKAEPARDEFDADTLSVRYLWMRQPDMNNYTLKGGKLALKPTSLGLGAQDGSPSVLFQRQNAISFTAQTEVELKGVSKGTEAGLTVFATEGSHYDIYIKESAEGLRLMLTYKLCEIDHTESDILLPKGVKKVTLRVTGTPEQYRFAYSTDGGRKFTELAAANTRYLSSETAGGFTGTVLGIFATSPDPKGEALFEYFENKPE